MTLRHPLLRIFFSVLLANATALSCLAAEPSPDSKVAEIVATLTRPLVSQVPAETDLKGYLMTYFKDETHALYFATSTDGFTFTDVNNGNPVFLGKDLAEQKGIRDPHIMRGPDNAFYLAMTDLHIYAQREGLRGSEWERSNDYGWGNNRSLILMKSYDLIHWTHSIVHVGELFPAFAELGCAWAPETIYDSEKKKLMVYFTTRIRNNPAHLVYSYVNDAFTSLEAEPKPLFVYPKEKINTIDGNITKVGGKYHLFYVSDEKPNGLRHAVSDKINEGYVFEPRKVDPEQVPCEAPNLWRRNGTDTYILMYDVFGATPNNMGFSETTDFVNYKNLGRFNDKDSPMKATHFSSPKHGAVMSITLDEVERLNAYFATKKQ